MTLSVVLIDLNGSGSRPMEDTMTAHAAVPLDTAPLTGERADLLDTLTFARTFLRGTTDGISDGQARERTTVSGLTLGGLIKHVTDTELQWRRFIVEGPSAMLRDDRDWTAWTEQDWADREASFVLLPQETLVDALQTYAEVAAETDALLASADLDAAQPLPDAPWFEPGAFRTARNVLLHVISETSQHAGHADIIREALDGKKSMA